MTDEIANVDDSELDAAFEEFAGGEPADAPEQDESEAQESETKAETPDEDSEGEQATESAEEPDEVAKLKAELQAANHKFNSVNGRINAYQRQINELKQQQSRPAPQQTSAGDNPQGSGMSDAKWEQLKEDYPDIAEAMEAQLNGVRSQYQTELKQLRQQVEPIQQKQQEAEYNQYRAAEEQALNSVHPDWEEVVRTREYKEWLQQQPYRIQQFMESDKAEDNIYLLNAFKSTRSNAQATPDANPVQQRRERQLQQARTIPNRSRTGGQSIIPEDDFDAAFEHYASQID